MNIIRVAENFSFEQCEIIHIQSLTINSAVCACGIFTLVIASFVRNSPTLTISLYNSKKNSLHIFFVNRPFWCEPAVGKKKNTASFEFSTKSLDPTNVGPEKKITSNEAVRISIMPVKARYIPWNEGLICLLLNIVLNKGAHKAKKNEVKKRWNAVNEAFFNHDKLQPFRLDVYKEGNPRKLRDKFQQVLSAGKEVLESDNKLDIPDEFRARYQLLQMIMIDSSDDEDENDLNDEHNEEERDEQDDSVEETTRAAVPSNSIQLDINEGDLFLPMNKNNINPTHKRKRDLPMCADNSAMKLRRDLVEDRLMKLIEDRIDTSTVFIESETKDRLLTFANTHRKTTDSLLAEAKVLNVDEKSLAILRDIGLDVMIDIYCTRGHELRVHEFKAAMVEMELTPLIAHKLYNALEQWRLQCEPVGAPSLSRSLRSSSASPNHTTDLLFDIMALFLLRDMDRSSKALL